VVMSQRRTARAGAHGALEAVELFEHSGWRGLAPLRAVRWDPGGDGRRVLGPG
jgi:hypothetical protein